MGTWDTGILCNDSVLNLMYDIKKLNVETELAPFIDNYTKNMVDRYISCSDVFLIIELIDMSLNGVDFEILVHDVNRFTKDLYGYGELFNRIAKHPMPQFLDWAINTFEESLKYEEENIVWSPDCVENRKHILDKIWNRLKIYADKQGGKLMNVDIPVFDCTVQYNKDHLVEYDHKVYVCDEEEVIGEFNRSDWHHAVVDIHINYTLSHSSSDAGGYDIQCVLVPYNFELMSFRGSIVESVLDAVQNISDRFSIRNIYLGRFCASYIRTRLINIGYNVLYGPTNGETYIDQVVILTKEKSGLNDGNLVHLYALLALVKGEDVTLKDVHDAWAMDMNFKEKNPPYCYGHDHKSVVPFDQLSVETQERDREYMEAIKEVANMISN